MAPTQYDANEQEEKSRSCSEPYRQFLLCTNLPLCQTSLLYISCRSCRGSWVVVFSPSRPPEERSLYPHLHALSCSTTGVNNSNLPLMLTLHKREALNGPWSRAHPPASAPRVSGSNKWRASAGRRDSEEPFLPLNGNTNESRARTRAAFYFD